MIRRPFCVSFAQHCRPALFGAAVAGPALACVALGVAQQQSRVHVGAVPCMTLAGRGCASSSSSSSSAHPSGTTSSAAEHQQSAVQGKRRNSVDKSEAARTNAMRSFATWWDTEVFNHDKDGNKASSAGVEIITYTFKDSIDRHYKRLNGADAADPAAREQLEGAIYAAFMRYVCDQPTQLIKLLAARKALADAPEPPPPNVAQKRQAVVRWLRDMLINFKHQNWSVFSGFPDVPLLQDNKHVVVALKTDKSALNQVLDKFDSGFDCVSDILRVLYSRFERAWLRRNILFSSEAARAFNERHVEPPILMTHLIDDGGFLPERGESSVDPSSEQFLIFTGESGSGKTIAALQYALSRWDMKPDAGRKRVGMYLLATEVFGAPGSFQLGPCQSKHEKQQQQQRQQQQPMSAEMEPAAKMRRNDYVIEAVSRKVLELVENTLALSVDKVDNAIESCWRIACRGIRPGAASMDGERGSTELFSQRAVESCFTIVIDDMSAHTQELRCLNSVSMSIGDALAVELNVAKVRIVAVGTGFDNSDGATMSVGSIPSRYRVVHLGGRREYWDDFKKAKKWKLALTDDVRRLLENPRRAALFAQELTRTCGDSEPEHTLVMQSLATAMQRFDRVNGPRE